MGGHLCPRPCHVLPANVPNKMLIVQLCKQGEWQLAFDFYLQTSKGLTKHEKEHVDVFEWTRSIWEFEKFWWGEDSKKKEAMRKALEVATKIK